MMDGFKRFSTLARILTRRNRTVPEIRHKLKYSQTYCSLACVSNLSGKPKKFENNFPLFKYQERQPVSHLGRCFCDVINRSRCHIQTFDLYYKPFPMLDVLMCNIKSSLIRLLVDKTFKTREFVESTEVAVKLVSKIISENKLDELDGFVTPECISELEKVTDNWVPMDRGDLAISESDFMSTVLYNVRVMDGDNGKGIQASLFYFIIKGIADDIGGNPMKADNIKDVREYIKKMESLMSSDAKKTYGANYRFMKWVHDDKPSDWIIDGINHFRIMNEYEEKKGQGSQ